MKYQNFIKNGEMKEGKSNFNTCEVFFVNNPIIEENDTMHNAIWENAIPEKWKKNFEEL